VKLDEVNPMFFAKPYYLEPEKGGVKAYALLRDALRESDKIGITKVVIKTRQHLAALKAQEKLLVLELMHFADELVDASDLKIPAAQQKASSRELQMARTLIDEMTKPFDPERYTDDYSSALLDLIKRKVRSGGRELPTEPKHRKKPGDLIDLVDVLKQSLAESGRGKRGSGNAKRTSTRKRSRKAAA
jgi:DNA end-binding protein Ku